MNNIQKVSDSYLCCNCGACVAACPKGAITFMKTNMGRLYASVDNKCIDCGLCKKVCPSIDEHKIITKYKDRFVGNILECYIGRSTDDNIFRNAQSGGVATAILTYLFEKKLIDAAIVCRMRIGEKPVVEPFIAKCVEDLFQTQRSCYTPVPLLTALKDIKQYNSVAIIGIPCHIQAVASIKQTFPQKYTNIKYLLGLVCDRTECETIQDVMVSFTDFEFAKISWRRKYIASKKKYDYNQAPIEIVSNTGEIRYLPKYYRMSLKEFFTPPRCRLCQDKINICADIVLGDPWRLPKVDHVKGESLVFSRTEIGDNLLKAMINEGYVELRNLNDSLAPIKSQIVDIRRVTSAATADSFQAIIQTYTESYLLSNENSFSAEESKKVKEALFSFVKMEHRSKSEIIESAKDLIIAERKKHTLSRRIINKIKSFIE